MGNFEKSTTLLFLCYLWGLCGRGGGRGEECEEGVGQVVAGTEVSPRGLVQITLRASAFCSAR